MKKDKALKILKDFHDESAIFSVRMALETLHPELKESEDERIRKELIEFVKSRSGFKQEYIAWIEKQCIPSNEDMKEALRTEYEKGRADVIAQMQKEWSEEDENMVRYIGNAITCKESAKYLEEKGVDMVTAHRWLESTKPQSKQEWSEEDEAKLKSILFHIEDVENKDVINWFKSLKDRVRHQNTWKPSDEQMYYLSWIANVKLGDGVVEQEVSKHLNSLYDDLKKLTE